MFDALHRKAIEKTYKGICNIYEYQTVTDEKTKLSRQESVLVHENKPCKLSYEKISVVDGNGVMQKDVVTKLFIAPEIEIKAGSKLEITQDNVTKEFAKSGEPARYASHQEIMLELFERWA